MHLLLATPGRVSDAETAVHLVQSPGAILFLSAADSELAGLAEARRQFEGGFPALRLASLLQLSHNLSVDLYVDEVVAQARLVIVRLIGGRGYWPYGVERLAALARDRGIALALLPGEDREDPDLTGQSTLPPEDCARLWRYCREGGAENWRNLLAWSGSFLGAALPWSEPVPLPRAGYHWPGLAQPGLAELAAHWRPDAPVVPILFYRALVQAGDLAPVDALVAALAGEGLNPLPIHVASLKDPVAAALVRETLDRHPPAVLLNLTAFALGDQADPLADCDRPVLQALLSSEDEAGWRDSLRGLAPRDLAMQVALPEIDGRIITRAIAVKRAEPIDPTVESAALRWQPLPDRIAFVAALAARWARLAATPPARRRIALVIASYPTDDGRVGCGVGLDTPASALAILQALAAAGYDVTDIPADGGALMARLAEARLPLSPAALADCLADLPADIAAAVTARWGAAATGQLQAIRCGAVAILIQPARLPAPADAGAAAPDAVKSAHHDLALLPPPDYLACYGWLRRRFDAHAVIHLGKHGTLEWLPGKALALSAGCLPEVVLGPLPHFYPFIVNDPGEGSQAKRRAQAVILDHLTPPLTKAGSYGPIARLERLVDEYYEAAGIDPRRLALLQGQILDLAAGIGLDRDLGATSGDDAGTLARIDNYLCDLKDLQIRDGLHVFGRSPEGGLLDDLALALIRQPRGKAVGGDASILRALAGDLGLGADPLTAEPAAAWSGPLPPALAATGPWRVQADMIEAIDGLAHDLITGRATAAPDWAATTAVLSEASDRIRPMLAACGAAELDGLLRGLDGRRVAPGPSGAPTRGRIDMLPTGRNFFAVDTRAIPTPAAWTLGWQSACLLVERYLQDHGDWPRSIAITAWGTANMRTGGDDIAQALALMGVRPVWEGPGQRVTGFEIMPAGVLDRPRIDVTLRISGFFRDAFPGQIELFDSAARAVAALDETEAVNPLAAAVRRETAALAAGGRTAEDALRLAGARVYGAAPGRYGTGLERLLAEPDRGSEIRGDVVGTVLAGGGHAYGVARFGEAAPEGFAARLTRLDAVVQAQDNREHDLLDSDSYYAFLGGMTAAAAELRGRAPATYVGDSANPQRPALRTLGEEIARVVHGRAANPRWIAGAMRHGHKGASELAATVDYLCAFASLVPAVGSHHFDAVYDAYVADAAVADFLRRANPAAAAAIARRLAAMIAQGQWQPRTNQAPEMLAALAAPALSPPARSPPARSPPTPSPASLPAGRVA